jgi:DNA-binding IclR family transcriptional regulator
MPKKSQISSVAEQQAAPGGTAAVDRALSLLAAFRPGDGSLGLQELAGRSRQHKSTVLRLLASLQHAQLVQRLEDGRYRLGPGVARLHAVYASSFSMDHVVVPELRRLMRATGESAAFHVRQGDARLCLYRVDSPHPVRDHIRVGDLLPLDRGAGGHVLLAFGGKPGARYDEIRRDGVAVLAGDRVPQLAGISAPCFDAGRRLVGAVTLTMPTERLDREYRNEVIAAARAISDALGGMPDVVDPSADGGPDVRGVGPVKGQRSASDRTALPRAASAGPAISSQVRTHSSRAMNTAALPRSLARPDSR